MKDYFDFFTNVVANHLHKLVDLLPNSSREHVLNRAWVFGVEKIWREFISSSDNDSDFVARLSFYIGGLRDKVRDNPTKTVIINILHKSFAVSTYCYFEFGEREDILDQIKMFVKEVDEWMEEDILSKKLKRFLVIRKMITFVNKTIDIIQYYHARKKHKEYFFEQEMDDDSEIETFFKELFRNFINEFIEIMTKYPNQYKEIKKDLDKFTKGCKSRNYPNIITKQQQKEINQFEDKFEVEKMIVDSIKLFNEFSFMNKEEILLEETYKTSVSVEEFKNKAKKILVDVMMDSLQKYFEDFIEKLETIQEIEKIWLNDLFDKKQKKQIDKLQKNSKIKRNLQKIVKKSLQLAEQYSDVPSPGAAFPELFAEDIRELDSLKILNNNFKIILDSLKEQPEEGDNIIYDLNRLVGVTEKYFEITKIKKEVKKLNNFAYLKINLINLFRRPKKEANVTIYHNNKELKTLITDESGDCLFEKILRGELTIKIKDKEYPVTLENYYNQKKIWLKTI